MHLLTYARNLVRDGYSGDGQLPAILAPVLDPRAIRIIVSEKFLDFAREFVLSDPIISSEYENFRLQGSCWFEIEFDGVKTGIDGREFTKMAWVFLDPRNIIFLQMGKDGYISAVKEKPGCEDHWKKLGSNAISHLSVAITCMITLIKTILLMSEMKLLFPLCSKNKQKRAFSIIFILKLNRSKRNEVFPGSTPPEKDGIGFAHMKCFPMEKAKKL